MKRKILVFTPFIALLLAGCNFLGPRIPLPPTSGQSTSTKPTSTTTPTPVDDTYGTLDNPISVARAIEIGNAIAGASSEGTVYETKDAYIKGYVQSEPERGDTTEYRFNIADSYEATTNIQFYWGFMESGVSVPIVGDEVVVFGRLANYKTRTIELAGKKLEGESGYEIEPPSVLKSNHVDCTITLGSYSHGTVTGVPATAVQNGTKVELVATPDEGYYVGSIKAYGQTLVEEGGKYSFTAYSSTTVSVEFVAGQKSALQEAYEAAIAAGTAGTTEEYTFTGVVIAMTKNAFYVQDGKYGIYVFSSSAVAGVDVGKSVTVKATMKLYYGQVETASVKDVTVGSTADLPASVQVTSQSQLSGLNQNIRAHLTDAVLATKQEWSASKNCIATFTVGTDTITVKFDKNAYKTDDPRGEVLANANVGDKIDLGDITPVPYNDNMQLVFTGTSTIVNKTTPSVVPVTGVKLNTDKLDFVLGGSAQTLTATVEPSNATNKKVSWSVNPTGIVSVNNGSVSPSAVGDAVVTVTTEDGNKTATCNVHVGYPAVNKVTVSPKTETLVVGGTTKTLTAKVEPELAQDKSVTWEVTAGSDYVSVDQNGVITPKAAGTATVTATSKSSPTISDSCTVTVTSSHVDVTSVTVSPATLSLEIGGTETLTANVLPDNASDKSVTWSTSDATKVSVNATSGAIEALAVTGNTPVTITATSNDNHEKTGTCEVTVTPKLVKTITVSPATLDLEVGDKETLTATVAPSDATDPTVTWSSSDSTKVSVNATSGAIEALAATETAVTITATANDGSGTTGTCSVTVADVPTKSSLQIAYEAVVGGDTSSKTFSGTIVSINKNAYVLQDGAYGINVYKAAPSGAKLGDLVEVTSTLKLYNGCPQTDSVTSDTIKGSGTAQTAASVGSKADLDALNHNVLANVAKAIYKSRNKDWSSTVSAQFVFTIGTDDITISFDKQAHSDDMAGIVNGAVVGDEFEFTNVITAAYSGTNQINFAGTSTAVCKTAPVAPTAIEFEEPKPYEITIGGTSLDVSAKVVLTPSNAKTTITYTVSTATGVSISDKGVLTATSAASAGSVTVTATTSNNLSATVSVTVKAAPTGDVYKQCDLQEGKILITTVYNNSTKYYLPTTTTSANPAGTEFTNVNLIDQSMLWNVTKSGDKWVFKNSDGKFLYITNSNSGIRVGSTSDSFSLDGTSSLKSTNQSRYIGIYSANGTTDWRSYTTKNATNYKGSGEALVFYTLA